MTAVAALGPGAGHDEIIRKVPLFAGLTPQQAERLYASGRTLTVAPGEFIIREGEPGDSLFIVLEGELEVTKRDGERDIRLAVRRPGEFLGEMSLLEHSPRTASVRALSAGRLLSIGPEAFREVLESSPAVATAVLRTVAGRLRSTEASLVQSDKLAALGTLAAGLAHELNNPAAAIQRSGELLREAFDAWRRRTVEINGVSFSQKERTALAALEGGITNCGLSRGDDPAVRREEERLLDHLDELGVAQAWDVAPALAAYGWTVERLAESVVGAFGPDHVNAVVQWLGAGLASQQLMEEIRRSAEAISQIVKSVKSYAYLDQAPVQNVDLATSLEDTLMILRHKLRQGVEVVRTIEPGLPRIEAYAGELNQVWTNIIDNAIQAMGGSGRLEVAARGVGDQVEVTIADSGPGIPPEVAPRIFEPFFTTKAQGVGTGLGLHIAHNIIVNRHHGRIDFETMPGRTAFHIVLPRRLASPAKG